MMKTQIGLGVLAIPLNFDVLGLVPGLICLFAIGGITTWSDYIVGVFKLNHPSVYGIDDVGEKIAGKPGRIIMGTAFVLFWIFCGGAAMLGISTALNALSSHGACTAIFVAVAAIAGGSLASIQTLGKISWLAWVGITCILASSMFTSVTYAPCPHTDFVSPYCHHRSGCPVSTGSCASDPRSICLGLEGYRQPEFLRSHLRSRFLGVRLRRHTCFLLHHLRDARSQAIHKILGGLSRYCYHHLHRGWHRCLHLLRLLCCFSGSRIGRPYSEESLLRACVAGSVGQLSDPTAFASQVLLRPFA